MAGNIAKRANGKWRARYRDKSGKENSRHFDRKIDAQQWLDQVTSALVNGHVRRSQGRTDHVRGVLRRVVGPPGVGTRLRAGNVAGGQIGALHREADEASPTLGRRDLDQADGRRRARSRHGQDAVCQRPVGVPRRREGSGDRLGPDRRRTPPPWPSGGRGHVDPDSRGGRAAHGRSRRPVPAVHRPLRVRWLRLGEAAGTQFGDVDFLRKTLKVCRQVPRVNGGAIDVRAPKYGTERVVYLAESLVNVLAEHVANHGTTGKARWLFAGEGDDPPHQNTVGDWWRKTLRDTSLSGIKLHDLRHFYASGPIAAGCDVVTVQRSLGHSKATTTLNTYAHLWPTAEDRTRKAAESIMSASLGEPAATLAEFAASTGE